MKKQALILTAALVTLSIAGCSESGSKPADTTTAAAAASTTTAAETTAATTTAAETTTAKAELTLPEERLFGGYVVSETDAELLSEPGEKGETLSKIPS
ncbi:MAG: hypothetical protein IK093_15260, partial [Ruminiclostridium sp.]|nr:hypothetical protein [Ruminiclostridium sp.]